MKQSLRKQSNFHFTQFFKFYLILNHKSYFIPSNLYTYEPSFIIFIVFRSKDDLVKKLDLFLQEFHPMFQNLSLFHIG